ncbi:MAG: nucleotidyltransferase family protein, partial [Sedimenticola sp.]
MATDLLSELLVNPKRAETFSMQEWDLLVCQAGHARLLGRLHHLFHANGLGEKVPGPVRWHFEAAARMTSRHKESVKWEAVQIQRALEKVGVPIVLLKGAAYAMCDLPAATGRLFLDIDILVPKPSLSDVETALNRSGWHATHHDEYDQRYYRKWMHELPPLKHLKRQTVLDVHHTILPETARLTPDPHLMILDSVPIEEEQDLYVLSPADMVLHSATHL